MYIINTSFASAAMRSYNTIHAIAANYAIYAARSAAIYGVDGKHQSQIAKPNAIQIS